jgi:hypothetical protein
MRKHSIMLCLMVGSIASCLVGAAGPHAKCCRCGATAPCKKVCRLVCEEKKVEVVCWGCKCENFCVPGPGCPSSEHCRCVCQTCDDGEKPSGVYSEPKRFIWKNWRPSFAQMYTKTKLMKRIETVKVPTYKWVVEEVCCDCTRDSDCDCDVVATDFAPAAPPTSTAPTSK